MGELFLLRHGETAWSKAGRHTGRTDLPLTGPGEDQARAAGSVLARLAGLSGPGPARPGGFALVLASPLQRAARTAELAGLTVDAAEPDLVEWDYGGYEGLTTEQIRTSRPGWRLFHDGVVPGATSGESLEQVVQRAVRVLARVRSALAAGDVALVGHGHALRVLATVWLHRPADLAQQLLLGSGSVSVLGAEHDVRAVRAWNVRS